MRSRLWTFTTKHYHWQIWLRTGELTVSRSTETGPRKGWWRRWRYCW